MTGYVLRRCGQAIVVVLGVTMVTFLMLHALPGNLARSIIGPRATPQQIATFDKQYGLSSPLWYQYWTFLDQLAHGNLGFSFHLSRPVTNLLATELPRATSYSEGWRFSYRWPSPFLSVWSRP